VNKNDLIFELQKAGIKHNPENILRIEKLSDNRIVFLEIGNLKSGFTHIINNHQEDFLNRGIEINELTDAIMTAITQGTIIGIQGNNRNIYEFNFKGIIQYISVNISNNGYIVGANPTPRKLIIRFTQGI